MEPKDDSISEAERQIFYTIDRAVYSRLVAEICRNPLESMQIIAVWHWLERVSCTCVMAKILSLSCALMAELADEAVTCLKCINDPRFFVLPGASGIPLTQNLIGKAITLEFIQENRAFAMQVLSKVVNDVCVKALADIMEKALKLNADRSLMQSKMMMSPTPDNSFFFWGTPEQALIHKFADFRLVGETSHGSIHTNDIPREIRTMFVTFSKGYPVYEWEVKEFFTRLFGDCIESFHMQDVRKDEQALYAKIVFSTPSIIEMILNGLPKAKFTINGKHVWMRKFVPKQTSTSSPPRLAPRGAF